MAAFRHLAKPAAIAGSGVSFLTATAFARSYSTLYEVPLVTYDGKDFDANQFRGKVCLAINVASQWGLTAKSYRQLKTLQDKYQSQGLEILAFPCNQFGGQEPWSEPQIVSWVNQKFGIVAGPGFWFFKKADVNGSNTQPAWRFFKQFNGSAIKWNFSGIYIINGQGEPVQFGGAMSGWDKIEGWVTDELAKLPRSSL